MMAVGMVVRKFAEEVVEPKSREMDENEKMDPSIIKGLFDQGVSTPLLLSHLLVMSLTQPPLDCS